MNKTAIIALLICVAAFAQQKGSFKDPRDGKTYKTTKIGEQVWMAENLNYNAKGSECYDNKPANCNKYGRLYNSSTAMKACPKGFHLPSKDEWETLVKFAGGDKVAGNKLRANSGWDKNGNGTDDYSFSALPGGYYEYLFSSPTGGGIDIGGGFVDVGITGTWWSSSKDNRDYAYFIHMGDLGDFYDGVVDDGVPTDQNEERSVRCLQD